MKIRNGFVSNSSSSSFVVIRHADVFTSKTPEKILTEKQENLLKKEGYTLQLCFYPHQVLGVGEGGPLPLKEEDVNIANWGKYVSCNQDYDIEFLLKNRISFMADVHYEHYSMVYDGKSDVLLIAQNYGKQAQMNGNDKINFDPWCKQGVERTTGKKYLKKYKL